MNDNNRVLPRSFTRVFADNKLSIGLLTPIEAYPNSPFPTLNDHQQLAKSAEDAGFASIWLRDVPFYDPNFGDAAQLLDPFVYAGYLSALTKEITLGTAGIVLPLRDPISVAKQAASVDMLTNGRFVLGLSTGDRPTEYPAFGVEFEQRAERYRDSIEMIQCLHTEHYPRMNSQFYGNLTGNLDLHPKPVHGRIPMMAVGRSRQPIEWLAQNMDAWIWSVDDERAIQEINASLKIAAEDKTPPKYGYATFFDLADNPDAPYQRFYNVVRIGRHALIERLLKHQELGVSHVALNLKPSQRSAQSVIDEMGTHVLPALKRG
ncbi:TIGR03571 family LLM class oxidoreductase [Vibrio sp. CAIM 722]|uniref:TIGR03571 family LLM class oxidoreductase n=1 Tax=Vibrio eleionomae TaxID=2653505 RepID=A0A7X4RUP5_9VIBR|nr:LLM class oxidoreductase [Vibrio eleionomae]MZI93324.1 TIGR03571 family LLM class oxidoreductase [Vibrio eleionomae]